MTYTPVIPSGGIGGWGFLVRTMPVQKKTFSADTVLQREEAYFREKIGKIDTADKLVGDRRLLAIALTAFGLEGDINNKFFLKKILEDGTLKTSALSNKLADKRYHEFSKAFGFGDFPVANTAKSDFAASILSAYEARSFEAAVGKQNPEMRLALNAQRELATLARRNISENGKWLSVLGSPPLRSVLQTALGLPQGFAGVDLDKQIAALKSASQKLIGSPEIGQFSDTAKVEKLLRLYLTRSQAQARAENVTSPALTLLKGSAGGTESSLLRYV